MKMFFEVVMIWGGPRLVKFVSQNLYGPEIHSVFRWRKQHSKSFHVGISKENYIVLSDIYSQIATAQVPVLMAEDETATVANVTYHAGKDVLQGFCGPIQDHSCQDNCEVHIGEGEEGYNNIVGAFQNKKIGTSARVIIINPLHPALPKLPIVVHPTCNQFDHHFVRGQWNVTEDLFKEHLEPLIGPLIGRSSDGDSRRRKLMLEEAMSNEGERYRPITQANGFIFSCRKHLLPNNTFQISGLFDQDYIHNHKKLVNHVFHTSRILMIGPHIVHSNHLVYVQESFHFQQHGLTREDVQRTDRQNWRSAQRISFCCVHDCLQQLIDGNNGNPPDPTVVGTLVFMKIVWHYVEIFCSPKAS